MAAAVALGVAGCVASPGDANASSTPDDANGSSPTSPTPPTTGDGSVGRRPEAYAALHLVNADDVAHAVRVRIANGAGESSFGATVELDGGGTARYAEALPLAATGMTDFPFAVRVDGGRPHREAVVLSRDGGRVVRVTVREGEVAIDFASSV